MCEVVCSKCGASRPPELTATSERPPCPQCGGTALTFNVSIEESVFVTEHCSAELVPGNQSRDWKQRWKVLQEDLQFISSPRTEVMSGDSIHSSLQCLCSFFIHAYHLKDALKDAAPGLGLTASEIEDAVTNDPRLALLADLANLDKHVNLTKQPRSGYAPVIQQISGVDSSTGNGWNLSAKIEHGATVLDGMAVAQDAAAAWREKLMVWGII